MLKPIVLCDVDGVILDWFSGYIDYVNERLGTHLLYEDATSHDLAKCFGVTRDDMKVISGDYEKLHYFETLWFIPRAMESIKVLQEEYQLVLATSCGVLREKPRKEFFREVLPGVPIEFTSGLANDYSGASERPNKLQVARKWGAYAIIEDNEIELKNWDPSVTLPICLAQPWNLSLIKTRKYIPCLTWPEIVDLLMNKRPMFVPSIWIA